MSRFLGLVLAALLAGGCVSATVVPMSATKYGPQPKDHPIDLYISDDAPVKLLKYAGEHRAPTMLPSDAELVGRMDVDGDENTGWSDVLKRARVEARKLGGDAVLCESAATPVTGSVGSGYQPGAIGVFSSSAMYGKSVTMKIFRYAADPPKP